MLHRLCQGDHVKYIMENLPCIMENQVLKPCKSVQESSEEVLDFKAQQLAQ